MLEKGAPARALKETGVAAAEAEKSVEATGVLDKKESPKRRVEDSIGEE